MEKLLKIKICLETEIVGENVYGDANIVKVGMEIFRANRDDIITQAMQMGEVSITAEEIDDVKQLPNGWTKKSLPWAYAVYGSKVQERKIEEFFNNKNSKI